MQNLSMEQSARRGMMEFKFGLQEVLTESQDETNKKTKYLVANV